MTENDSARVSSQVSDASIDASATKQRRKREWDQPDESLISTCVSVPGILPFSSVGIPASVPGLAPASCALWTNPLAAIYANTSQVQAPIIQQQATAVVQKLNQPKIQEELIIAREIVINDADPAVRYKLTKRQTQEEIQKCTGAVVITRGKYRPPNAVPDGEKPLYLHISAAANLKETAERILAVDRAAAMVEEMLKGHNLPTTSSFSPTVNSSIEVSQPLSTCVYLGFDADPSLDIPARIRGPNDQYINHIMNETGAKVFLRGQGSGNHGSIDGEEGQQPLHLFLSCNNQKGLEDARLLAENLLETISRDCGATRVPSGKIYKAVPPPEQLLTGVQSLGVDPNLNPSTMASLASSGATLVTGIPVPSYTASGVTTTSYGLGSQSNGLFSSMRCQANEDPYSQPLSSGCSSYNGYAGVYPHATPLHQVALALRQASPVILTVHSATSATNAVSRSSASCPAELTKRPPQKRKFQESPVILQETAVNHQGSEVMESSNSFTNIGPTKVATSPLPKKLGDPPSNGVLPPFSRSILPTPPPPPPRSMPPPSPRNVSSMPPVASRSMAPPPPPPPKFSATVPVHKTSDTESLLSKSKRETVPDTLVKLMEYGDDEDDDDEPHENEHESFEKNTDIIAPSKPFWAV